MKKILLIIVLIAIVAGGTYQYMRMNTYSYHLDKAEAALDRIDAVLEGNAPIALIPTVYAQDDKAIIDDANTAVDEIGEAQNAADHIGNEADRSEAQQDINDTKGHAESTFNAAMEASASDDSKNELEKLADELDNIKPGKSDDQTTRLPDESDPNNDPAMEAEGTHHDNEEENDNEDDEEENEPPIDEAEGTNSNDDSAVNDNNDADYAAAEADATERYQPYLDWEYGDPVPLENQKQLDKDTAETPTIDPALMQDAINKMMEQQ
jgi:hypothetical protein